MTFYITIFTLYIENSYNVCVSTAAIGPYETGGKHLWSLALFISSSNFVCMHIVGQILQEMRAINFDSCARISDQLPL